MAVNGGWIRGIAEVVGGTIIGSLVLRMFGLATLEARLTALEQVRRENHAEVLDRLKVIEAVLLNK